MLRLKTFPRHRTSVRKRLNAVTLSREGSMRAPIILKPGLLIGYHSYALVMLYIHSCSFLFKCLVRLVPVIQSVSASGCPSGSSSHPWPRWLWPWPPPPCQRTPRHQADPRGRARRLIGSGPARGHSGAPVEHNERDVTQTDWEGAKSERLRPHADSTSPDPPSLSTICAAHAYSLATFSQLKSYRRSWAWNNACHIESWEDSAVQKHCSTFNTLSMINK